ncbi:hypothetical protein EZV61_14665 [Corallincola luteus]|uniref:BIG2 domain-containing protein n=1 Tax=Corallincola luteus TaxID=1775177 RepID=A0ABY2AHR9_9GAMM|nr:hypothetical protein [Corallincola luteus]TCI02177.1 hypothetical protein EZV61_14665 [Corallincola luteus]
MIQRITEQRPKYSPLFILATSLLLVACGGGGGGSDTPVDDAPVAMALSLSAGKTELKMGDTSQLVLNVAYDDGSSQPVSASDLQWQCVSSAVEIDQNNLLTAKQSGTTDCTANWQQLSLLVSFSVAESSVVVDLIRTSPLGPLTLTVGAQQTVGVFAHYSDDSNTQISSGLVWQCDSDAVSMSGERTGQVGHVLTAVAPGQVTCSVQWQGLSTELQITVQQVSEVSAELSLSFLDHLKDSDQDLSRFTAWVERAVAGNPGYGFSPVDAVYLYYLTADERYIQHAITLVEQQVLDAETKIAEGQRPKVSSDSYLHVGRFISELAYTYAYGGELLSDGQKLRWRQYAEQAVWNVWHHKEAEWGGQPFPWSGWAVTQPGNNYHFSFLKATMTWGLADKNEHWLTLLKEQKLPTLVAYFADFEGGGSREGTGYGVAQGNLFDLYRIWKDATGMDLAGRSPHARQTIDYWIHATTPTLDQFSPIGDQSRVSFPRLFDYHENLIHRAASLNIGSPEAKRGKWWLDNNSVTEIVYGFNLHTTLLAQESEPVAPTDLVYHSKGAGHLFVRSSWQPDATWLSVVAGIYDESHASRDQGAFSLFKDEWLAVTQNIWSHSGIHQATEVHNTLRFVENGETVRQNLDAESSMDYQVVGDTTTIQMELSPVYGKNNSITSWQRDITFTADEVMVFDQCVISSDVEAIWQINLPVQPEILADGSIQSGQLLITPMVPAAPDISVINWVDVNASEYKNGHYKLELSGGDCRYQVRLNVL